jgi:hypothetical protein
MSQRTLLASVVLFRELYSGDKDVYDVIAEFVKGALQFAQKWSVNTTEATELLSKEFELSLPEAVVGTTLHKRLFKRDEFFSYENGIYTTSKAKLANSQPLVDELRRLQSLQQAVLTRLVTFIESTAGELGAEQKEVLSKCFCDYMFDSDLSTRFSDDISAFVLKSQNDPDLIGQLNAIREGFVLYDGVRHTQDLSQLGSWKTKLVVFLDTEHLFNAVGMNGSLHKQLCKDFISLASDARAKGNRLISLRYFSECADEVDRFFRVAEHIVEGRTPLDPSKPAMATIVEGCATKGDVITKKAKFIADLALLGIRQVDANDELALEKFNVESLGLLEKVRTDIQGKGRDFNEEKCVGTLRMFTKVNSLRGGESQKPFEDIGAILVSGSYIANYLAFHPDIRGANGSIPYATDLEFITNRLWFKLQKNLAKGMSHPQSLSVLAKAQVVLASQVKNSVSEKFDEIRKDFSRGRISEEQTKYLFNELRAYVTSPEALTETEVDSVLAFLDHKDYEHHLRERSHLQKRVEAGNEAISKLDAIHSAQIARRTKFSTIASFVVHGFGTLCVLALAVASCIIAYKLLAKLGSGEGDFLSVLGIIITVVIGVLPVIGWRKLLEWAKGSHSRLVKRLVEPRA